MQLYHKYYCSKAGFVFNRLNILARKPDGKKHFTENKRKKTLDIVFMMC